MVKLYVISGNPVIFAGRFELEKDATSAAVELYQITASALFCMSGSVGVAARPFVAGNVADLGLAI